MITKGAGSSDPGPNRSENQDAFLANDAVGVFAVSDGMGGHHGGETASRVAIDTAVKFIRRRKAEIEDEQLSGPDRRAEYLRMATDSILAACEEVHQTSRSQPELRGMGATLSLLIVDQNDAFLAHVGDSRVYLSRGDSVHQVSQDHTVVQEMIDRGVMTPEQAENSPYAHVLSRAIGVHRSVQVDTLHLDLLPGDRFLLCSDGLLPGIESNWKKVQEVLKLDPKQAARELVVSACAHGTTDNATALIVAAEAREDEVEEQEIRRSEVQLKVQSLRSVYMFQQLSLSELARVIDMASVEYVKAGASVYREGDNDRSLYLILIGELEVQQQGEKIAELMQGNHFGEMALLAGRNRAYDVVAKRDSKLFRIREEDFKRLVREKPITGVKLLSEISRELGRRLYISTRVQ